MRFGAIAVLSTSSLLFFIASSACDDSPSTSTASDAGSAQEASTSSPADGEAPTDDGGTSCNPPVNGALSDESGTFAATIDNGSANLAKPAPGTMPCEGRFNLNGGISLGGNQYTGAFSITCWGSEGELYFGFNVTGAGKPKAGDSFPIGHGSSLLLGDGGYGSNGQVDLAWEEGPRCDTKQDKSKSWNAEAQIGKHGALIIDGLAGSAMTFHVTETDLTVSTNGLNYKGTGVFTVSGNGTVKVTGL